MATDNTILNPGATGDTIRDIDKGGVKTQVIIQDYGGSGAEDLTPRDTGSGVVTAATPRIVEATDSPLITAVNTLTKPADQQHVIVDSSASIVVTGPLTDTQLRASAVPVSAASLPLPSLAATSTKQSDGSQKTQVVDGSGNVIGSTSNALDVNVKSSTGITANVTVTNAAGASAVNIQDGGNSITIDATSLPLPTLAATSTKQSDGSQKSQVVDGSGNVVGSTGNALDINIKSGSIGNTAFGVNNSGGASAVNIQDGGNTITVDGAVSVSNMIPAVETGLAKDSSLSTINSTLGSPFQAGGSIGNTSFGATQTTASQLNMTEASAAASKADLDTIVTNTDPLTTAQAADASSVTGPMIQGMGDTREPVLLGFTSPFRLDGVGRLLVNTNSENITWSRSPFDAAADINFFDSAW